METTHKEVRFDIYCKKCKYKDLEDAKDPCNECLEYPYNESTEKPVKFKEESNA